MQHIKRTEVVRVNLPNDLNTTFNSRERTLNVEIQKVIDAYNKKGFTVVDREIVHKSATHASVKFIIQKLISL
jgi:predicted GNAT superfamily acetyltransferase